MNVMNETVASSESPFEQSPLFSLLLLSLATQRFSPKTQKHFLNEYDYIVVGAGSSGATVAARLSEIPCVSVLLLEAGEEPSILTEVPAFFGPPFWGKCNWGYKTVPQNHTASILINRQLSFHSGKCLGGSSSINGLVYTRGNRHNYDEWSSMGAEGWSYDEVLPYFLKLENNGDIDVLLNGYHSIGGPVDANRFNYKSEASDEIEKAALNSGYKFVDANGPTQYGFCDQQNTIRNGQSCSTAKAYLVPNENRINLDIVKSAFVTKVLTQDSRAIGVEFEFDGKTHQVRATREVILSAGVINTPKILMLSGIGPREELEKLQIPVIADLPVGRNFHDQVASSVFFELDENIPAYAEKLANNANIWDYILFRKGPLASSSMDFIAFLSNDQMNELDDKPDYELKFLEGVSFEPSNIEREIYNKTFGPLQNKALLMCMSFVMNPKSRGSIRLRSSDPHDPPEIDPNYLEQHEDTRYIVEGMKTCLRVMSEAPVHEVVKKWVPIKYPDCENLTDDLDSYLECCVRSYTQPGLHGVGTARMGNVSDPSTVVDPELRVKSITDLRVVDCSIMPTIPWGHTNVPAIMVGEKAADMIKHSIICNK